MREGILPLLLVVVLTGSVVALLVQDHLRARHLRLRVKKLYASQLFEELLPMLKTAKKRHIEQLMIDKTGLAIRYFQPAGAEAAFLMRVHGYAYLTPEQQEALRMVLEECLPSLRDGRRYCLSRRRIRLVNGDTEFVYRYTIANPYKAMLVRAPYYDGSLQATTRLW